MRWILVAALLVATTMQAVACEVPVLANARTLNDGKGFALTWRSVPAQPKVGEFFVIEFASCAIGGASAAETFRIDAIMPAHKHGMNFQPKVTMVRPALYRAEGLMFHMPGTWQLIFEQRSPSGPVRLATEVEIE
jgi:hypothetical protein